MSDFWTAVTKTNYNAAPLNIDDLRATIKRVEEEDTARQAELSERGRRFLESVPERLRKHPLVSLMLGLVVTGTPIHPKDHERMKADFEALLASDFGSGEQA